MDLFFIASKVLWGIAQPLNLLAGLAIIGTLLLLTGHVKSGMFLAALSAAFILVLGIFPVGERLCAVLENRFADIPLPAHADGIIVLGGTLQTLEDLRKAESGLGAPRLRKALVMMHRFQNAQVYFSGFSSKIFSKEPSEYELAKQFFTSSGADLSRIRYEKRARNTYQNGIYLKSLVKPQSKQVWLLITSAAHMPRSVGVFRKIGWDVVPVPAGFTTTDQHSFSPQRFSFAGITKLNDAVREYTGLLVYYLSDKTSALFPTPDKSTEEKKGSM